MAAPAQPQQKKTLLMTEGSIWKSILLFSVPLILGNLLQQLYNTADSIIVGNFLGSNALAAVGSSGSPIYLLIGFSQGVAVGAGVVVSQYLGAKDKKETRIAVHTSLAIAVILGLILTVGGIAVSRSLLVWMNTPEEVLGDAVTYMKLYFGGVLFSVVYNMAAGILNAAGNSRRSVIYLACASITNIILDLVLIAGLKMGVAGAAIATVISQIASCVIGFAYMHRKYALLRFSLRELRLDVKTAGRILQVGAPMAIQQSIVSCGFLFLQRLVNYYGESMIASYTVATRMENILMIPILGVQNTMATFAGQNMGAQRPDRVSRGLGQGVLVSLSMTLVLCLCQIFGISRIIRAFQLDEAAAAICRLHLFSSAVAMPIFAVYFPANGMCQGVGEGFHATFFALLALGLRVIFAYALHNTALFGYTAVWWSQAMAWTVTLLVCYAHVFRGKWKTKSLIS